MHRQRLAPLLAAVSVTIMLVIIALVARSDRGSGPFPPEPVVRDRAALSLDRCAAALAVAGLSTRYPDRRGWRPLAGLEHGDVTVAMLDAPVPFVCATGATTVDVSDPQVAVAIDAARLLLSTPAGVLAAVAPDGLRVDISRAAERPPGYAADRYFLDVTAQPVTDAGQLAVAVGDPAGVTDRGPPERLALPALHVVDRRAVPPDRSTEAAALLRRCLDVQSDIEPRPWTPALVVTHDQTSVLVTASRGAVGGCVLTPAGATPLRVWRIGLESDWPRPFVWLPEPGAELPDLGAGVAAGPVQDRIARLEITAAAGRSWAADLGGGTFLTHLPAGVPPDPRHLTVRAYDVDNHLVYDGPARS